MDFSKEWRRSHLEPHLKMDKLKQNSKNHE